MTTNPHKFGGRTWEEHVEATRETAQLTFDWMKHMSTLSLGSVLAISGSLQALFPEPERVWLVLVALLSLTGTAAGSLLAMLYAIILRVPPEIMVHETQDAPDTRLSMRKAYTVLLTFAVLSFLVGVAAFTLFALVNGIQ